MARLKKGNLTKPWKAECKIDRLTYFVGYFPTKPEAELAEREFRTKMRGKPDVGHTDCRCHPYSKVVPRL
jgi:hypothetical protein